MSWTYETMSHRNVKPRQFEHNGSFLSKKKVKNYNVPITVFTIHLLLHVELYGLSMDKKILF